MKYVKLTNKTHDDFRILNSKPVQTRPTHFSSLLAGLSVGLSSN